MARLRVIVGMFDRGIDHGRAGGMGDGDRAFAGVGHRVRQRALDAHRDSKEVAPVIGTARCGWPIEIIRMPSDISEGSRCRPDNDVIWRGGDERLAATRHRG
ncbi:hypothetical protein [Bradyrhizobium sp. 1(2017)]|uniref:hypothetical protein n=1 Tax=Bradyrhizobium sp. 1(2017) TaxID=1404888 RepID=UPI001FEFD6EB|nr:hypothetical protein [Bradyrhizobium sp. 1(2017)]